MLCGGFLAAGPGRHIKVEGEMNAAKCREILNENLMQSARELHLGRFVFEQDNDLKHKMLSTNEKIKHKWF